MLPLPGHLSTSCRHCCRPHTPHPQVITEYRSRQIAEYAFEYALLNNRKKVGRSSAAMQRAAAQHPGTARLLCRHLALGSAVKQRAGRKQTVSCGARCVRRARRPCRRLLEVVVEGVPPRCGP
jgi:hypothetical protein